MAASGKELHHISLFLVKWAKETVVEQSCGLTALCECNRRSKQVALLQQKQQQFFCTWRQLGGGGGGGVQRSLHPNRPSQRIPRPNIH